MTGSQSKGESVQQGRQIITLLPVMAGTFLCLGLVFGGHWTWLALAILLTCGAYRSAEISPRPPSWLPEVLGVMHFAVLGCAIAFIPELPWQSAIAPVCAVGLYLAQVSNSTAHELIHARRRGAAGLGIAMLASHLFAHHNSAHRLVHHVHVATPADPNTPRPGESIYRFIPRAWAGSFSAGLIEERRRQHAGIYVVYAVLSLACVTLSTVIGGPEGLAIHVGLALYATTMLLATDYVQHYGLARKRRANGRYEPVGARHAWDAPSGLADLMMLNAPRHARHHMSPGETFDLLDRPDGSNRLPFSLLVMIWLAFMPRTWRHVMDKRVPQAE